MDIYEFIISRLQIVTLRSVTDIYKKTCISPSIPHVPYPYYKQLNVKTAKTLWHIRSFEPDSRYFESLSIAKTSLNMKQAIMHAIIVLYTIEYTMSVHLLALS